jgi:hypothetical protein
MARKKAAGGLQGDALYDYYNNAKHLILEVGWQGDGGAYGLDLDSYDRIRAAYPDAPVNPDGMLLGYDQARDYDRYHRPYWPQIALMLTGLTEDQIAQLGGIELFDTTAGRVLWSWKRDLTALPA